MAVFIREDYVKLQQAYVSESGNLWGNWTIIGYQAPGEVTAAGTEAGGTKAGNTNFTYEDAENFATADDANGIKKNTRHLSDGDAGWTASNKNNLNDCKATNSSWTVSVAEANNAASQAAVGVAFTSTVNGDGCEELTPNFSSIGK